MALHTEIAQALGMPVYFCEKASPWQRPSNENTNGLLRQYFPKGTDLRSHDAERLADVADELNTRPRKTLSWQTPAARIPASVSLAMERASEGPRLVPHEGSTHGSARGKHAREPQRRVTE